MSTLILARQFRGVRRSAAKRASAFAGVLSCHLVDWFESEVLITVILIFIAVYIFVHSSM